MSRILNTERRFLVIVTYIDGTAASASHFVIQSKCYETAVRLIERFISDDKSVLANLGIREDALHLRSALEAGIHDFQVIPFERLIQQVALEIPEDERSDRHLFAVGYRR